MILKKLILPRSSTFIYTAVTIIFLVGFVVSRMNQWYPLFDSYPLYYGSQAFFETGNAYNLDAAVDYKTISAFTDEKTGKIFYSYELLHTVGNAYPLPAVLLFTPWSLLPARWAAITWIAFIIIIMAIAIRLAGGSVWWLMYWSVCQALRLEQYTGFVLAMGIFAIAAFLNHDKWKYAHWVFGFSCMLMLTKPNHSLFIIALLLWQARYWQAARKPLIIAFSIIWVLPTLIDPNWLLEWYQAREQYSFYTKLFIPWFLAILAIPFLRQRNWLGAAIIAHFSFMPYLAHYAFSLLSLTALRHSLSWVLVAISWAWFVAFVIVDTPDRVTSDLVWNLIVCLLPLLIIQLRELGQKTESGEWIKLNQPIPPQTPSSIV